MNVFTPPRLAIEDCTVWNRHAKHLFKTKRLRAELQAIGRAAVLIVSALVFDGKWLPRPIGLSVKLNNVGDSVQTERFRLKLQAAGNAKVAAAFAAGFVRLVVQYAAFGGEVVLGPLSLDVDECALARAEREVLQR